MVNPNTPYQLVAYAEDGYAFANWLIMDATNQTKTLSANPLTYSFASEMRVIANFAPVQDTTQTVIVVAVASPEEGGQVDLIVDGAVWNPTKDAAGNTYYELPQNTTCTLAAVSYEGYTFAKWDVYVEGVPTTEVGADNVFTYTFKSNASVIAYFDGGETSDTTQTDTTVKTVTVLAVAEPANSGKVEITGVAATADYNGNSVYTLDPETTYEVVATPAKGYKFLSWRIMDATTQGISVEGNPFTYKFTEDAQVIAIFTEDQPVIDDSTRYNVTWEVYGVPATVGGAEVVVAGAEKAVTFQGYIVEPGITYGIRFTEPQGYKFAYATYVMGNMYDSLSAGNTMVFTDNTQIMAYYEEDKTSSDTTQTDTTDNTVTVWTLSQPTEGGSVEITGVTPSANYDGWLVYYLDSEVAYQLVATPANGYKFSAWRILSNDGQGVSLEENPMIYKFTENSQAIAIFTEESGSDTTQTDTTDNTVTVWTLSEPTQGGSVEITGVTPSAKYDGWLVYYLNPEVAYQLVATPADGYKFSSWRILSNDGQGVSLENNPTTYKFTENSQAIAIFTEEKYYTLTTITNLPNAGEAVYYPVESAYKEGETVMFFADSSIYNPDAFKFEAWIVNGVRQVERTIQVTMTRNTLVELVVSEIVPPAYYHLYTMVPDSNAGAIYVTPEDTAYLEGTIVSLYPMIDTLNYDIDTWVVNGKRVAGHNLVLTMDKDYQVVLLTKDKPVITNPEYNVTFIVRPDSVGSANYNSGMYEEGTVLSLAPYTYSNEYEFSNWYINGKYVQAKNPKVTITEETTIILMYKQKQQYSVNTSVVVKDNTEEEVAAVSLASGKYISGETYTVTPVIYDEDYKFSAWIINGNMVDEEEFEITITKSYQITLLVEPVEQGQEAPTQFSVIMNFLPDTNVCTANVTSGIYEAGQEIELKPIIYNQDEYEFNAWVVNGEVYSTEVVVVTVEKDMNISLIAVEKVLVEDDEIPEDVTVDLTAASDTTSSVSLIWTPVEDADYYTVDVMVGGVIVSSYVVDAEGRVIKSDKDVALNLDELIAAGVTYHFEIVPYTEDGEVIEEEIISGRFTTLKSTDAINETKAEVATNFKAYGVERAVVVENAENNVVSVFDINGRRVANTINVNDAKVRIAVPRMGVYVVRVGNAAAKVYVR